MSDFIEYSMLDQQTNKFQETCNNYASSMRWKELLEYCRSQDSDKNLIQIKSWLLLSLICQQNYEEAYSFCTEHVSRLNGQDIFYFEICSHMVNDHCKAIECGKILLKHDILNADVCNYLAGSFYYQTQYNKSLFLSNTAIALGCTSRWSTYNIGRSTLAKQNVKRINISDGLRKMNSEIFLICPGGGFGDMIWSYRTTLLYKRYFTTVNIVCPKQLYALFSMFNCCDNVYSSDSNELQLLSVNAKTKWDKLPNIDKVKDSGYLKECYELSYGYNDSLNRTNKKLQNIILKMRFLRNSGYKLVCIAWKAGVADPKRNFELDAFKKLSQLNKIVLISVQKGFNQENIRRQSSFSNYFIDCQDQIDELGDFSHTLTILKNADILVSVDTSVAHLGGSAGIESHILVSNNGDPHYFDKNNRSSSYNSMIDHRFDENELNVHSGYQVIEEVYNKIIETTNS